jgi:hypothetical protein
MSSASPIEPLWTRSTFIISELSWRLENLSPEGELILALIATLDERTPSGRRPKGAVRDRVMCRLMGSLRERPATVEPAMDVVFFNLPRGSYRPATADEGSSTP